MSEKVCSNCKFYFELPQVVAGGELLFERCRRYPPSYTGTTFEWEFAKVNADDTCGEYKGG